MAQSNPPALKILMLHGFTNTGQIFHSKTRALEKSLIKAFGPSTALTYLDGPHRLRPSEIPSYLGEERRDPRSQVPDDTEVDSFAWWKRKDPAPNSNDPIVYAGMDESLKLIAETMRTKGPFDGVIGFSQGACAAGVVAALLEPGRREAMEKAHAANTKRMPFPSSFLGEGEKGLVQPQLKFAVIYSGFCAPEEVYGALYEPKLSTPGLNVIGSLDTIVDEGRSRALLERFERGEVLVHPGGHFCPSSREVLDGVVGFVRGAMGMDEGGDGSGSGSGSAGKRGLGEERVEDMEMPF